MRGRKVSEAAERMRIVAGMGGVVAVTLLLLLVQLHLDTGATFGAQTSEPVQAASSRLSSISP